MRSIGTAALTVVMFVLLMTSVACDPVQSFEFTNNTDVGLVVTYKVYGRDDDARPLAENSYRLDQGGTIDTQNDESLSGDRGGQIFNSSHELLVCASTVERLEYLRLFSYEDAEAADFRFAISPEDLGTGVTGEDDTCDRS